MGSRRKLLYCAGRLLDALTAEVLGAWPLVREQYDLTEYRVVLGLRSGAEVVIWEDEEAAWLREGDRTTCLTEGRVRLPRFEGHPQASLLRQLHHELLVNIVPAGPVPNLLVYARPWYRDSAMVAMCLQRTGNLHVLADWIAGLREPFDRNNAGNCEPDNLGQLLYLISLSGASDHPLIPAILDAAEELREGDHIVGITDGVPHPVYQTKWLKLGLRALGLPDPWAIPPVYDSYSSLFWMDFRERHVRGAPFGSDSAANYPYLAWAEAHFHGWPAPSLNCPGTVAGGVSPLTWEAHASEANYERMGIVGEEYVRLRLSTPHTWHAAEVFLFTLGD
jgi:hypothetical protein